MPPVSRYIRFFRQSAELLDPTSFYLADAPLGAEPSSPSLPAAPGAFTTFRTHTGKQPSSRSPASHTVFGLDRHIARLLSDAQALGFYQAGLHLHQPYWLQQLTLAHAGAFAEEFGLQSSPIKVRLILRPEEMLDLYLERYEPLWSSLRAIRMHSVDDEREKPLHKTTLVECSRRARHAAAANGADEALLVTRQRIVREGAWSNIFWFDKGGRLHTTGECVLPGITRQVLLEAHRCLLTEIELDMLLEEAVEIFVTQSTSGITPVGMIDGHLIHHGSPGPLTLSLREWYEDRVSSFGVSLTCR